MAEKRFTYRTKVRVRNSESEPYQNAVFIGFVAGGDDGEGIYLCRMEDGEKKRFMEVVPAVDNPEPKTRKDIMLQKLVKAGFSPEDAQKAIEWVINSD